MGWAHNHQGWQITRRNPPEGLHTTNPKIRGYIEWQVDEAGEDKKRQVGGVEDRWEDLKAARGSGFGDHGDTVSSLVMMGRPGGWLDRSWQRNMPNILRINTIPTHIVIIPTLGNTILISVTITWHIPTSPSISQHPSTSFQYFLLLSWHLLVFQTAHI
jgi:hypothetical protein